MDSGIKMCSKCQEIKKKGFLFKTENLEYVKCNCKCEEYFKKIYDEKSKYPNIIISLRPSAYDRISWIYFVQCNKCSHNSATEKIPFTEAQRLLKAWDIIQKNMLKEGKFPFLNPVS